MSKRTGHEAEVLTPGSFVVERYVYNRPKGGKGTQWVVHRVHKLGGLEQLIATDTRHEAAEFIARAASGGALTPQ